MSIAPTSTQTLQAKKPLQNDPQTGLPEDFTAMLAKMAVDQAAEHWQTQQALNNGQTPPTVAETAGKKAEALIQQKMQERFAQNNPPQQQQPQGTGLAAAAQAGPPPVQAAQGGLTKLGSNLPKSYAGGGIIAFAGPQGSFVDPNSPYALPEDTTAERQYKEAMIRQYEDRMAREIDTNPAAKAAAKEKATRYLTGSDPNVTGENGGREARHNPLAYDYSTPPVAVPDIPQAPAPARPASASEAALRPQMEGGMGADPAAIRRELAAAAQGLKEVTNPQDRAQLQAYVQDLQKQLAAIGNPSEVPGQAPVTAAAPAAPSAPNPYKELEALMATRTTDALNMDRKNERDESDAYMERMFGKDFRANAAEVRQGLKAAYEQRKKMQGDWVDSAGDIARMFGKTGSDGRPDLLAGSLDSIESRNKRLAGYNKEDQDYYSAMRTLNSDDLGFGKDVANAGKSAYERAMTMNQAGLTAGASLVNSEENRKSRELLAATTAEQRTQDSVQRAAQAAAELAAKIEKATGDRQQAQQALHVKAREYALGMVQKDIMSINMTDEEKKAKAEMYYKSFFENLPGYTASAEGQNRDSQFKVLR